jgi:hypothetical protein
MIHPAAGGKPAAPTASPAIWANQVQFSFLKLRPQHPTQHGQRTPDDAPALPAYGSVAVGCRFGKEVPNILVNLV